MSDKKKLLNLVPEDMAEDVLDYVVKKRGSRLKGNRTKIGQLGNGQFIVTIPKAFALGYGLKKGDVAEWDITQRGLLLKHGDKR